MYEKALKWLGDILHFSPSVELFRPTKRQHHYKDNNNNNNGHNQNPSNLPPCNLKVTGTHLYSTANLTNVGSISIPWSSQLGRIQRTFLPLPQGDPRSQITGHNNIPLCSSLHNINSSIRPNVTTGLRDKFSLHGKWLGGGGRAWGPPGLEGGEDGSGTTQVTNTFENKLGNLTYPDYGFYNYNYDYDQSDWLSNHLEELYEIMRSSQVDTNIALTAFLTVVFLFGVTGNILVLAVFSRGAVQQQASTVFIKALAITDLIICLVVLPGVLLKEWYIPYRWDALCQAWELVRCSTIPLSNLILASVAVDRYVKICRVDRSLHISTTTAKKILLATATVSVCLGIPPMLRMGVYQAGEGPDAPNVYLGLCMGNDLLVSKETVDRYWQAMAAKFLLVLLVVTVMYGLVFRTVYKQSRRWGRCAANTNDHPHDKSGEGSTTRKVWFKKSSHNENGSGRFNEGWINKGYEKNDDDDDEDDDSGEECQERKKSSRYSQVCRQGDATGCSHRDNNHESNCYNNGASSKSQLPHDTRHSKQTETDNVKHCWSRSNVNFGKGTRQTNHVMRRTETINVEKKKSSLSLSLFLCNSKRNNDVVTARPPKISYQHQNDLHDDGVTSLDDGHMSYLNNPSSSQQSEEKKKKKHVPAIFSCTSQLTVSRSAFVSKKSYYRSDTDVDTEYENAREEIKPKLKNGVAFVPQWLRRWKRLVTVALFTTAAQREEGQRSAVKLALRQKAKIKMMNQEASCDIEAYAPSQELPHLNTESQMKEYTTENTDTTKLSSSNVVNNLVTLSETKLRPMKKLKKRNQSLDMEIINPDHKNTTAHRNVFEVNFQQMVQQKPLGNITTFEEKTVTIDSDGSARKHQNTSCSSTTLGVCDQSAPFPIPGSTHQYISTYFMTPCCIQEENGSQDLVQIPQVNENSANKPGNDPLQAPLSHHEVHDTLAYVDPCSVTPRQHKKVLNTTSCPPSSRMGDKLTSRGSRGVAGGNKVHPLNASLFSRSVPNMRVTQAVMLSDLRGNNSENDHAVFASHKKWVSFEPVLSDESIGSENNDTNVDTDVRKQDEMSRLTRDEEQNITESEILREVYKFRALERRSHFKEHVPDTLAQPSPKQATSACYIPGVNKEARKQIIEEEKLCPNPYPHYSQEQSTKQTQNGRSRNNGRVNLKAEGVNRRGTVDGEDNGVDRARTVPKHRYNRAQVKTAQVLFLVTVVYVLCFAPVLLMSVEAVPPHPIPFYGYFIHSAANPVLYSFINEAFRSQLYHLLCPRYAKTK